MSAVVLFLCARCLQLYLRSAFYKRTLLKQYLDNAMQPDETSTLLSGCVYT